MRLVRRTWKWVAIGLVVLLVAIQFVPYGRDHSNPTGGQPVSWDSPRTEQLMRGACMDCHSNETEWPWYSNVAPVSWLVQSDVNSGRDNFNFSEWNKPHEANADDMAEAIRGGSMPPWYYTIQHRDAKLNSQQKEALIRGLTATLGASPPGD